MAVKRHITGTAHQGGNFTAGKMPTTALEFSFSVGSGRSTRRLSPAASGNIRLFITRCCRSLYPQRHQHYAQCLYLKQLDKIIATYHTETQSGQSSYLCVLHAEITPIRQPQSAPSGVSLRCRLIRNIPTRHKVHSDTVHFYFCSTYYCCRRTCAGTPHCA